MRRARTRGDRIEESEQRPTAELDDARRRYYRLTSLGRRVLAAESARLEDLVGRIKAAQALDWGLADAMEDH